MLQTYISLLIIVSFAIFSFVFALAESALFSLGSWQTIRLGKKSPELGALIKRALANPHELLATILLGNTVSNAVIVATGMWMLLSELWPKIPTVVSLFALILLICEVAPKAIAVRLPEAWALQIIRPIIFIQNRTRPFHWVARRVNDWILKKLIPKSVKPQGATTDEDYEELLELGYQHGSLDQDEKEIILDIIELDQKTAGDVMTPRTELSAVSDELSIQEMIAAAREHKHRRLPVYDDSPDTIVGVLDVRNLLLNPDIDLEEVMEMPSFVPETMNLLELFKNFQRTKRGMAIVVDEFGGTAGVITIEDMLEEVLGQIRSEGEQAEFVFEHLGIGRWRVNGTMRIEDFAEECPSLGEVEEVDTMGGLITMRMGVVPVAGQHVEFRGLRLTARVADERRVKELLVEQVGKGGKSKA